MGRVQQSMLRDRPTLLALFAKGFGITIAVIIGLSFVISFFIKCGGNKEGGRGRIGQ
jgi:hypothetical protein